MSESGISSEMLNVVGSSGTEVTSSKRLERAREMEETRGKGQELVDKIVDVFDLGGVLNGGKLELDMEGLNDYVRRMTHEGTSKNVDLNIAYGIGMAKQGLQKEEGTFPADGLKNVFKLLIHESTLDGERLDNLGRDVGDSLVKPEINEVVKQIDEKISGGSIGMSFTSETKDKVSGLVDTCEQFVNLVYKPSQNTTNI